MKYIFSDFDGTITWEEKLTPIFFEIIAEVRRLNAELIIVTGRSLSWGHFLLTHFPFKTCIAEGGGVILHKKGHKVIEELMVTKNEVQDLFSLTRRLLEENPDIELAYDSFGRKTDRAIDLHELDDLQNTSVKAQLTKLGANHSQSNVHINFWCGEISKFKAVDHFLKQNNATPKDGIYFGDSMNDESMFQHFEHSIGVSNISDIIDRLTYKPKVILDGDVNRGPGGVLSYLREL